MNGWGRHHYRLGWSLVGVALALLLLSPARLLACAWLGWPLAIHTVQSTPWLPNHPVTVQGQIGQPIPLIGAAVYPVTDSTGQLWVLAPINGLPVGQTQRVRGIIRVEAFDPLLPYPDRLYLEVPNP